MTDKLVKEDALVKYIPENDYESRDFKPFYSLSGDMCTRCKAYYSMLHEKGLTKYPFPPNCSGKVLDSTISVTEDDFDTLEDYENYIIASDPVSWAYRYLGWEARWYQEEILSCTSLRIVARMGRRIGKALDINTPIPTPNGWKTMGELNVGDKVFDDNGDQCNVTFVTDVQYGRKCYDVYFSDGSKITADEDHQWTVVNKNSRKALKEPHRIYRPITLTTREILAEIKVSNKKECNYAIEVAGAVEYSKKELAVHPYVFGVWLGDGSSYSGQITTEDSQILDEVSKLGYAYHINVPLSKNCGNANAYRIDSLTSDLNKVIALKNTKDDLPSKYIPDIYLQSSIEDRKELLKGLMDTGGCIYGNGICEFSVTSKKLAEGFHELISSLGIKSKIKESDAKLYSKIISKRYRITFCPDFSVFKLKRKLSRQRTYSNRVNFRYITDIVEVNSVPVKCISVDSASSLYLAGKSFIPTHNTICLVIKIMWLLNTNSNFSILVVAPYEVQVRKIFDEIDKFIDSSPELTNAVKRRTKSPCRLEFMNGSKAQGFSSGSQSASGSDKIRGQDAHYIAIDEADYLDEDDIDAILAILASYPDCGLWASSTPTGLHKKFFQFVQQKDLGFKEFWMISAEAPNWTPEVEQFLKESTASAQYEHEYLALFGIQESGVFRNDLVDESIRSYKLPMKQTPGSITCIGVDWNGQSIGTHIVVTECVSNPNGDVYYVLLEKIIIKGVEFTQHVGVEKLIELNNKYNPKFIYVDAGYGEANIEMLRKYGKQHRASGLHKKVVPYMMGSLIEIRDPVSNQIVKKNAKPFLVNTAVVQLEQGRVIFPSSEDTKILVDSTENKETGAISGIVQQMRNFCIERVSSTGLPSYSQGEDHSLTAWMLSIAAFVIELSDMKGRIHIQTPMIMRNMLLPPTTDDAHPTKQGDLVATAARSFLLNNKNVDIRDARRIYSRERSNIAKGDEKTIKKYFGRKSVDRTSALKPGWPFRDKGRGRF